MLKIHWIDKKMLPALLWSIFVVIGCLIPANEVPEGIEHLSDKGIHFFIHFVLTLLTAIGLMKANRGTAQYNSIILISVLYSIVLGIVMELMQHYLVIGRYGEILDAVADAIGAILAIPLVVYLTYPCRQ